MFLFVLLVVAIAFIIFATARLKLHPFLALLIAAFGFGILSGMPLADVVKSVNDGFGGTIGYIGIVILAGAIIGAFLEHSGGAYRLAESVLRITGRNNVPAAMSIMGYVVSIPVFCDSGFILLSPLNKALCRRAGISIAASAIALSLGLYATHTMVPPTPGPIAAAGIIKADIGLVILWGLFIAAIACLGGWLFAVTVARRFQISPDKPGASPPPLPSMENSPSAFASLMPILIPILLIVLRSVAEFPTKPLGEGIIREGTGLCRTAGGRAVARRGSGPAAAEEARAGDALGQGIGRQGHPRCRDIIIITGAGGAFGKVLQNSGIAAVVGDSLSNTPLGILLPFVIAAGIKTAQGSSTVSIITTAGLMAPLLTPLGLDGETAKALVVVAIGAGAMVVSHANDSFFWVVTQFSNMSPETGYKLQTLGTLVEGVVAGAAGWATAAVVL